MVAGIDGGGEPLRLSILGSTGSIGQSTLEVVRAHPGRFVIDTLAARSNIAQLAADAREFDARLAVSADDGRLDDLRAALAGSGVAVAAGKAAMVEAAGRPVDMVMAAIVGADGLEPTLAALGSGAAVALANKECLVCAGNLFMARAKKAGARVIPVDSEHSAIFQCFEQHNAAGVDRVTLTASGGPFRTRSLDELAGVTRAEALNHPNWSMGAKVTIDSATLMNKGLELIEAFHLFPVAVDQLDAVIHPQSIVHSLVSYVDGSVLAQMGVPDMKTPIAVALGWPQRIAAPVERLDLVALSKLTFEAIDRQRFPAVSLSLAALRAGGSATTVLNAANEVAVAEFLSQRIAFLAITQVVEAVLERAETEAMTADATDVAEIFAVDGWARRIAGELARQLQT